MDNFKNGDDVYYFDNRMNIVKSVFDEYWEYQVCYITVGDKSKTIDPDILFDSKESLIKARIDELKKRILRTPDAIRDLEQRQEEDSKEIVALNELLDK